MSLTSRIFRQLRGSVLDNGCTCKRALARTHLSRRLNIDHAPVQRTVHQLRRRGVLQSDNHNLIIRNVAGRSMTSVLSVHIHVRNVTMHQTIRRVASRRGRRLVRTILLRRFCIAHYSPRRVRRRSRRFRRLVCTKYNDVALRHALIPLRHGTRGFHHTSIRHPSHTKRSTTRRHTVTRTVLTNSTSGTRHLVVSRVNGTQLGVVKRWRL